MNNSKQIHLLEPNLPFIDELDFFSFYESKKKDPKYHQLKFENKLKRILKTNKTVCSLSSGTAAIHLSLILSEVEDGDVVFCTNSTFIATVNPILYLKAEPYFVDINFETGNINTEYLEEAIIETIKSGKKPKAIIVTHSYGVPCDMDELIRIKNKYGLKLIEDSAESLGSKYKGKYCGTIADYGILSFNSNKLNTTFGGGALIVSNKKERSLIKQLSTHSKMSEYDYIHDKLAYNYRMNDLAAYVGWNQLDNLEIELKNKIKVNNNYSKFLKLFQPVNSDVKLNHWLNCFKLDEEKDLIEIIDFANKHNIFLRRVWFPLNRQPYLTSFNYIGENESYDFYKKVLCLPSSSNLKLNEIKRVANLINNI
ncbi:dTDP-4-amino-4,6-dideoxygalactose transaminase [Lutibacter sp. Hel_I_33_5]|uniref:DegT/DnrJ/EryC1/StrS family aminotransferase n=1 Tax=Lutibacter sp. Hel_I_33_5 TaxID=1566289 RepID=UPI0011ABC781|nr:DegT/DnrJ/EryC1/StrS family aminotransferase [Lutibacter sp. Hel_I_33_5]TVZ55484.1 dTDP-4-amino-4,6-dideoxygalactose transaminase [Lutibacter sp. Hel_I_33_5]